MAELIAQGPQPDQRWRKHLPQDQEFVLGRQSAPWHVPWDPYMSRAHVRLRWDGRVLQVRRLPEATNPVFFQGQERDEFSVQVGEHFYIGQTRFTVRADRIQVIQELPEPLHEQTFTAQFLHQLPFRNAVARLDALSRLPQVLNTAAGEHDLAVRIVSHLLSALPGADAVALVQVVQPNSTQAQVEVIHWDCRYDAWPSLQPSRRLILEALRSGQSVLHIWNAEGSSGGAFTMAEGRDWAFCVPVVSEGETPWAFYVTGQSWSNPGTTSDPAELREDVKFTEIVAAMLGAIRRLQALQRRQATLAQFFPPAVLRVLQQRSAQEVLAPQKCQVSVLFCDLRGFSRTAEREAGDLMGLLRRVSRALGVMTRCILNTGGVIGDFHGDAAMGFWGWPLEQEDLVLRAARAALAIDREFRRAAAAQDHLLRDFRVGIGLATGTAVAGGIGTAEQLKVTVFGPVVNLASRLEGMTRLFHASVLMDEPTAQAIRSAGPELRCRRVACVQPYGMNEAVWVHELLPSEKELPHLTNDHLRWYEEALEEFVQGHWGRALELLHRVPPQDRVKDFLTRYILQRDRTPPENWNGVIVLESKS